MAHCLSSPRVLSCDAVSRHQVAGASAGPGVRGRLLLCRPLGEAEATPNHLRRQRGTALQLPQFTAEGAASVQQRTDCARTRVSAFAPHCAGVLQHHGTNGVSTVGTRPVQTKVPRVDGGWRWRQFLCRHSLSLVQLNLRTCCSLSVAGCRRGPTCSASTTVGPCATQQGGPFQPCTCLRRHVRHGAACQLAPCQGEWPEPQGSAQASLLRVNLRSAATYQHGSLSLAPKPWLAKLRTGLGARLRTLMWPLLMTIAWPPTSEMCDPQEPVCA